jgi:flagellin
MIINNNLPALNTYNKLTFNNSQNAKNLEKLSSGLRINRAADDAAGLSISEKMRGQIRGLNQAGRNAQDSISLIQTAEGALNETHSILQRMRELAVQSVNDTNTDADRKAIQGEINQLVSEIDRIGNSTEFNTRKILNGDVTGIREKVDGSVVINNNSGVTGVSFSAADLARIASGSDINGAITIMKTSGTTAGSTGVFVAYDAYGVRLASTAASPVNINSGAGTIQFSITGVAGGTNVTLNLTDAASSASMAQWAVGESITIVFQKAENAQVLDPARSLTAQIGANSGQTLEFGMRDMRAEALGLKDLTHFATTGYTGTTVNVSTKYGSTAAISIIENALQKVSAERSKVGAIQNRLEHTVNNVSTAAENTQAAESRIRDVDMAKEMMAFTKNNILSQASNAMLAQAMQQPQNVLQLLR